MLPVESIGALMLLALTDSLSFGTLLVPVWLLMTPGRLRVRRILIYLGAVGLMYFCIGILLITGAQSVLDPTTEVLASTPVLMIQLVVGVSLLVLSFALDTKAARAHATSRATQPGRMSRWRERAMNDNTATAALIGLAITAVLVEIASMLPYLVATGIIATQTSTWPVALIALAGYCTVMIAPALVLTAGRTFARQLVDEPLGRIDNWLTRYARSTTLWIIGIAGFFLAGSAVQSLNLIP